MSDVQINGMSNGRYEGPEYARNRNLVAILVVCSM